MSSTITSTVADAKASAAGRTRPATATVPTVGVPSAPPLPADLEALLRGLRLPHIRRHAPEVLATAKAKNSASAAVFAFGCRSSAPAGCGGKCASRTFGLPGVARE